MLVDPLFFEITAVTVLAALAGALARLLRQPPLLGYLFAGILLGQTPWLRISEPSFFHLFSKLGVTFLLFMVGLEISFREIKEEGRAMLLSGVAQIIFTFLAGLLVAYLLGFSWSISLYLSLALTFSSTIVVVKLLSEKNELDTLHGKIALGILLVQDLVAILVLILLSGLAKEGISNSSLSLTLVVGKMFLLFTAVLLLSRTLIPRLFDKLGHSPETLFLISIAWCFFLSALTSSPYIGFSIEIGGLLAGLSLANSVESYQIASWLRPLRDYFLTMFFVVLGMQMSFASLEQLIIPAAVLIVFVLLFTPLIIFFLLILYGFRSRTSFLAGISLAQVSEFSLVIFALGYKLGHLDTSSLTLITAVGIVTIAVSSYFILHGKSLYGRFAPVLRLFERHISQEEHFESGELVNHIVLIGCDRMGKSLLRSFGDETKEALLIVDINPEVVNRLKQLGFKVLFGDVTAPGVLLRANPSRARIVVSTIPGEEENAFILKGISELKRKPPVIVTAISNPTAQRLYQLGADYVAFPQFIGGCFLASLLKGRGVTGRIESLRKEQLDWIREIEEAYQPRVDA